MCDIASVLMIGSTLIGAYGQYQAGQQAAEMGKVRADIARKQAADAISRGRQEEEAHRRKVAAMKGKQRATIGSNLVEMDSGSASDVLADTAMLGELDALTIRNNAQREAYYRESEARIAEVEGKNAKSSATMGAMGSLLGGVGGTLVDAKWYDSRSAWNTDSLTSPF